MEAKRTMLGDFDKGSKKKSGSTCEPVTRMNALIDAEACEVATNDQAESDEGFKKILKFLMNI